MERDVVVARAGIDATTIRPAGRTPAADAENAATGGKTAAATGAATTARAAAVPTMTAVAGPRRILHPAGKVGRTDTLRPPAAPVGIAAAIMATVESGPQRTVVGGTTAQIGGHATTGRATDARQVAAMEIRMAEARAVEAEAAEAQAVASTGQATVRSAIESRGSGARTGRRADSSGSVSNAPIGR